MLRKLTFFKRGKNYCLNNFISYNILYNIIEQYNFILLKTFYLRRVEDVDRNNSYTRINATLRSVRGPRSAEVVVVI